MFAIPRRILRATALALLSSGTLVACPSIPEYGLQTEMVVDGGTTNHPDGTSGKEGGALVDALADGLLPLTKHYLFVTAPPGTTGVIPGAGDALDNARTICEDEAKKSVLLTGHTQWIPLLRTAARTPYTNANGDGFTGEWFSPADPSTVQVKKLAQGIAPEHDRFAYADGTKVAGKITIWVGGNNNDACDDWTSASGQGRIGEVGPGMNLTSWLGTGSRSCNSEAQLLCAEAP